MKTLIVYFSYSGKCGLAAEILRDALSAETLELKLSDDKARKGLSKYIWGGKMAVSHIKPSLKPYEAAWKDYDLIVIGGPVWAGSLSPVLSTFLDETKITGKKIALFCCYGGSKGRFFDQIKALLPGNTFVGEEAFSVPSGSKQTEALEKVRVWAKAIAAP
jgi:flavodoxin